MLCAQNASMRMSRSGICYVVVGAIFLSVTAVAADGPTAGVTNGLGMQFILVKPGQQVLPYRRDQTRTLKVEKPFYLGKFEVTQAEWEAVMGSNPSHFRGPKQPVESVTWVECVEFCKLLSETFDAKYRLPTEAEWEYACRAGAVTRYSFGDSDAKLGEYAWYGANSGDGVTDQGKAINGSTHPVGTRKPNAWGFYDMHGNVHEWCADEYRVGPSTRVWHERRTGVPDNRTYQVVRGGAYAFDSIACLSMWRNPYPEGGRSKVVGFRVVLDILRSTEGGTAREFGLRGSLPSTTRGKE